MISAGGLGLPRQEFFIRRGQTPEGGSIPPVPGGDHFPDPASISLTRRARVCEKINKARREIAIIFGLFLDEKTTRQKIVT
ncbi:MAG: hypothetical protein PHS14_03180 [Elusimicrobia bacterium]|nr:hypothetical protein [Elusimicrobiota bacterium]